MKGIRTKQLIIIGCLLFGILILIGSFQVIFSPYTFIRVVSLIPVIGLSVGIGAFIRELFILNKTKQANQ
jgi:hypothetical protein